MVLKFQVKVAGAEYFRHFQGQSLRPFLVPLQEQGGDLAPQASRQADEPLVVLAQQLLVHPGFIIKTFPVPLGHQAH